MRLRYVVRNRRKECAPGMPAACMRRHATKYEITPPVLDLNSSPSASPRMPIRKALSSGVRSTTRVPAKVLGLSWTEVPTAVLVTESVMFWRSQSAEVRARASPILRPVPARRAHRALYCPFALPSAWVTAAGAIRGAFAEVGLTTGRSINSAFQVRGYSSSPCSLSALPTTSLTAPTTLMIVEADRPSADSLATRTLRVLLLISERSRAPKSAYACSRLASYLRTVAALMGLRRRVCAVLMNVSACCLKFILISMFKRLAQTRPDVKNYFVLVLSSSISSTCPTRPVAPGSTSWLAGSSPPPDNTSTRFDASLMNLIASSGIGGSSRNLIEESTS